VNRSAYAELLGGLVATSKAKANLREQRVLDANYQGR
jgi:hypothetical protein